MCVCVCVCVRAYEFVCLRAWMRIGKPAERCQQVITKNWRRFFFFFFFF